MSLSVRFAANIAYVRYYWLYSARENLLIKQKKSLHLELESTRNPMQKFVFVALLFISTGANAITYNITQLPPLSATGGSTAYGMNSSGQVVGNSYNSATGLYEAVVWNNGAVISLGVQGMARAINDSGTVVGETGSDAASSTGVGNGVAFMYSGGVYTSLGTLGGTASGAWGINNSGTIVGMSNIGADPANVLKAHAFKYSGGVMTDLGTNAPDGYSRAHGINAAGESVGRGSVGTFTGSDKFMAYWDSTNALTIVPGPTTYSTAYDINNNGIIVGNGRSLTSGLDQRAMWWDENGVIHTLDPFAGGNRSQFWALNDAGVMVGYARNGVTAASDRATISYDGITLIDLNTLVVDLTGWQTLTQAYDINGSGQIVGVGILSNGQQGAFILTAVPIPAAVWLFASGLGLLGWMRRKR